MNRFMKIGDTVLQYHILEKLGAGGMGVVYKALDTPLNRVVALKFLSEVSQADERDRARFLQEARAASAINHANVCVIYDLKEYKGEQFIVMEYVDGMTLKQLQGDDLLPMMTCIDYALQMASAFTAAHERGILHRDIKSENIMVTTAGQIKVMDFGLALVKGTQRLTRSSSTLGTLAYMSPEQIEGTNVDARSDIFSFGVVLYELLSGRLPFTGENQAAVIHAILNLSPTPIENVRPVPPELATLLSRLLEKEASKRVSSFLEIIAALKVIRSGDLPEDEIKRREHFTERKRPSREIKRQHLLWLICLLLTVVSSVVFLWFKPFSRKPEKAMNIIPLTNEPGVADGAVFSPSGREIAFHWQPTNDQNFDIYIKQISTGQVLQLTKSPSDENWPTWSPDGQNIAFCRSTGPAEMGLFIISSLGGVERMVWSGYCSQPCWSPDGDLIAFSEFNSGGIHLLNVKTLQVKQLTFPQWRNAPIFVDCSAAFSPDGKTVAFVRLESYATGDIYTVALNGSKLNRITHDHCGLEGLTWTPDGRRIIFSSARAISQKLWSIDRDGSSIKAVAASGINSYTPRVSSDGRWLLYAEYRGGLYDIGRIKIPPHPQMVSLEKVLASSGNETFINISPDGQYFTFTSTQAGPSEIWRSDNRGMNLIKLTSFNCHSGTSRWSPDGSKITFDSRPFGDSDIFVVSGEGGEPVRMTFSTIDEGLASWSRDGQWIYYSCPTDGRHELWKIPSTGGTPVRITSQGCYVAFEAFDGQSIFYNKIGHPFIWQCDLDGKNEKALFACSYDTRAWSLEQNGIYFVRWNSSEKQYHISRYDLSAETVVDLAYLKDFALIFSPELSPDGQWIYLSCMEQVPQSDIMLVENFQ